MVGLLTRFRRFCRSIVSENEMIFSAAKAAQVIAFFARERGGTLEVIEASKLAYLADRAFMDRYGLTILGDSFCQMEFGPVCSITYDLIKGEGSPDDIKVWREYITPRLGHKLKLKRMVEDEELEELSDAELEVLYDVHEQFKTIKGFALVDWVHKNCPEWDSPGKTSAPLLPEDIFSALNKENSEELADRLRQFTRLAYHLEKSK